MLKDLTIESLARELHEITLQAVDEVLGRPGSERYFLGAKVPWSELSLPQIEVRREQARLLFERIMR